MDLEHGRESCLNERMKSVRTNGRASRTQQGESTPSREAGRPRGCLLVRPIWRWKPDWHTDYDSPVRESLQGPRNMGVEVAEWVRKPSERVLRWQGTVRAGRILAPVLSRMCKRPRRCNMTRRGREGQMAIIDCSRWPLKIFVSHSVFPPV
jgi:hypothetical protein